jgi:hypothetical protein
MERMRMKVALVAVCIACGFMGCVAHHLAKGKPICQVLWLYD